MSLTALMTAALLGQSAFSLAVEAPAASKVQDVAYEELASGRSDAALRKLEASSAVRAGDPAALINLGAAYAAAGRTDKAIVSYRAAMASSDRYELELADGSWMDSRLAARTALNRLLSANAQASR
ncbi:tetratricopeptide repeat protein [Novosphingobium beihaiensis]|uniref:Tetratricopeptide repeat protein n=1 Tax=Novosphingobium beihaiensis TaxID=2930389 RepID=A0ABT0BKU6_9SPHN|nr:tetratricopeptide repeat protein [Novosphingobium beihaiensis]MCJ2185573.1 tetratricopeptide repeat protein [Novosphingobium beihaiensis]